MKKLKIHDFNPRKIASACKDVCLRFPVASCLMVSITLYALIWTWMPSGSFNYFFREYLPLYTYFIYATALSLVCSLFFENTSVKRLYTILINIAIILIGFCISLWWKRSEHLHFFYCPDGGIQYRYLLWTESILAVGVLFFAPFLKKNTENAYIRYLHYVPLSFLKSFILFTILCLGIIGAIYSVNLLFDFKTNYEFIISIVIVCYSACCLHFATQLPDTAQLFDNQAVNQSKFFKILGLYVLTPLIFIYTAILYLYLIKNLILFQMPDAPLCWLVSSLLCVAMFSIHCLYGEIGDNKLVDFMAHKMWLVFLPLVIWMNIGLVYRFSEYGITANRWYFLIFTIWLYIAIAILFFTHSRKLKWLCISFCLLSVINSFGPWSAYNIAYQSRLHTLLSILDKNGLLVDGKFECGTINKAVGKLDSISSEQVISAAEYLGECDAKALYPYCQDCGKISEYSRSPINRYKVERSLDTTVEHSFSYERGSFPTMGYAYARPFHNFTSIAHPSCGIRTKDNKIIYSLTNEKGDSLQYDISECVIGIDQYVEWGEKRIAYPVFTAGTDDSKIFIETLYYSKDTLMKEDDLTKYKIKSISGYWLTNER